MFTSNSFKTLITLNILLYPILDVFANDGLYSDKSSVLFQDKKSKFTANNRVKTQMENFLRKSAQHRDSKYPNNSELLHDEIEEYKHEGKKLPRKRKPIAYNPGELTVHENGLTLSTGLKSTIVATVGEAVTYTAFDVGVSSDIQFHEKPDGAACFPMDSKGWVYVSNSEGRYGGGGVGAIYFNEKGQVTRYKRLLEGTTRNCSGGKTFYKTWISCEENKSMGQCYEVDPFGNYPSNRTVLGGDGGNYEAFTFDNRDKLQPRFFVTEDSRYGALRRFTPYKETVVEALETGNYWKLLTSDGTMEYLVLYPDAKKGNDTGVFKWTSNEEEARNSSAAHYPYSEGIDQRDGTLFFVAKYNSHLFTLDLDKNTYIRSSTESGAFEGQPDQVTCALEGKDGLLYFTEDTKTSGVHGRDWNAENYYTILDGTNYTSETTGLAFSPDRMHMYVAFQRNPGILFDVTRLDGKPFYGKKIHIRYHHPKGGKHSALNHTIDDTGWD